MRIFSLIPLFSLFSLETNKYPRWSLVLDTHSNSVCWKKATVITSKQRISAGFQFLPYRKCRQPLLLIIAILLLVPVESKAQSKGYILEGDSALSQGTIRFNPSHPREIVFSSYNASKKYTADQVSEFGYHDSTQYIAKKIQYEGKYQKVFLQLLEKGTLNLWKLPSRRNEYYLEDSTFIQLNKENYLRVLKAKTHLCAQWATEYPLIRFRKHSLSKVIELNNLQKCHYIPFFSNGIAGGYALFKMHIPEGSYLFEEFGAFQLKATSFSLGLFTDVPLWATDNLSILSEIGYHQQVYIKELMAPHLNQDIRIEMSNVDLLMAPKYTFNLKHIRPYLFLGGSFLYTFQSSSDIFQAQIEPYKIMLERYTDYPVHTFLLDWNERWSRRSSLLPI